jgi:hypothetical protein
MLKPTVTEPKPVAVTSSSYVPLSSENDTTLEALVVPDRTSGKRKAKSWLFLNTVTVAPGTLSASAGSGLQQKKDERSPKNHAIRTMHRRIRQTYEAQTYRQAHTRG